VRGAALESGICAAPEAAAAALSGPGSAVQAVTGWARQEAAQGQRGSPRETRPFPCAPTDQWGQKAIRRKTTGTGRMRYMKTVARRFKNGFQEGENEGTGAAPNVMASTRGPLGSSAKQRRHAVHASDAVRQHVKLWLVKQRASDAASHTLRIGGVVPYVRCRCGGEEGDHRLSVSQHDSLSMLLVAGSWV
jgi:hypothetical protein